MSEKAKNCSRCGASGESTGALIKYKDKLICDQCIIRYNNELITLLDVREPQSNEDGGLEDRDDYGNYDDEDFWFPFSGNLKEDKLDSMLKKREDYTSLKELQVSPETLGVLPRELIYAMRVLPIRREGDTLVVAICEASRENAVEEIRKLTGLKVKTISVDDYEIDEAIDRFFNL